jgi:hypothetical protein
MIRYADYTPSAGNIIASKWGAGGNSWLFTVNTTDGLLRLVWYTGSSTIGVNSTVAPTISDYEKRAFRVTLDVDNGASGYTVTFYESTDFSTWTQLGDAVVGGATTVISTGTEPINIGARNASTADIATGMIYRVRQLASISGASVLDVDFSTPTKKLANGDTFVCATGQTVTLNSSGATGARIAGERDLYQGTAANRPVYLGFSGTKYGYLNGASGNYFSTPDAAPVSITGDLEIVMRINASDYTPASAAYLVTKGSVAGNLAYSLLFDPSGTLRFDISVDGTANSVVYSDAPGFTDGVETWIKVSRVAATGVVTYSKSTDGVTYSQIGATKTTTSGSIYDSTAALHLGVNTAGTGNMFTGRILYASVSGTIGGAAAAVFNASSYTGGTTFTASTGEIWTLNGGATIVTRSGLYFDGSNDYLKSAAFSYAQPESVYFVGSQVSWTSGRYLFDGNAQNGGTVYMQTATPRLTQYVASNGATSTDLAVATSAVLTSVFNGASSVLRVNRGTAATGDVGAGSMNGFTLGASGLVNAWSNITASEVALYSAAHNTATQDRWALYGGRRHGIAV